MNKTKIAINGFGRIGICAVRAIAQRNDVELVAINSTNPEEDMIYLLKYDSVHGNIKQEVSIENHILKIGENLSARIFSTRDIENLNFGGEGAEVVIDATGQFLTQESVQAHLKNGVKKVIMSAPAKDNTPTYVIGVNHEDYKSENIISNASCTTNCLGPIAKFLDDTYGIEKGLITTIHASTGSQSVVDTKNIKDKRRGRAAGVNIIPTTTGAAKAMSKIMPQLEGKLHGQSVRVPTPNISLVDANFILKENVTLDEVQKQLEIASNTTYKGIIEYDQDYRVSTDCIGNSHSAIIASDMIQVVDGNMLKIMAWYDNEWGYTCRLVDMCVFVRSSSLPVSSHLTSPKGEE